MLSYSIACYSLVWLNFADEIANSTLNDESQIEMVDIIASTPCKSIPGPVVKQDAAEIESLKEQMSKMQMVINISVFLSFFTFIKSVGLRLMT